MASPSRAKRSELEHDSFASTLPESIGGKVAAANMDGPDADSGTCCFGRPLILTPAQRVNGTDAFAKPTHRHHHPFFKLIPVFSPNSDSLQSLFSQGVGVP
jgi:hypothetical protein